MRIEYWKWFLLVCLSVLLSSCGGVVTQYYVLNTITLPNVVDDAEHGDIAKASILNGGLQQVAIRQLEIPRYLDRPRIVSRDAQNHLRISETHQWGGRLRDDLARTLSDDLADRLGSVSVFTAPFPGSMHADVSFLIDIRQFELLADGHVHLKVRWHIQRARNHALSYFDQMRSESVIAQNDYAAMAGAMSQLLAQLSEKMAKAVMNLPFQAPPAQTE